MARYGRHTYEVAGMQMGHLPRRTPMGMDPNYQGGTYRGQRMRGQEERAPYGRYRAQHARELDEHGGFRGRATGTGMLRDPGPMEPSGPVGPAPRSTVALRGQHGSIPNPHEQWMQQGRGGYGERKSRGRAYDREFRDADRGGYGAMPNDRRNVRRRGSEPNRRAGDRYGMADASRPLRYDGGFRRYGGFRSDFSEGFLGSAR